MAEHVLLLLGEIAVFVGLDTSVSIVKQVSLNSYIAINRIKYISITEI